MLRLAFSFTSRSGVDRLSVSTVNRHSTVVAATSALTNIVTCAQRGYATTQSNVPTIRCASAPYTWSHQYAAGHTCVALSRRTNCSAASTQHRSYTNAATAKKPSASTNTRVRNAPRDPPPPEMEFSSIVPTGVANALAAQGLTNPTAIQAAAMPVILSGSHTLLASHTGSGKTLAYLLPLMQNLNRDEDAGVTTRLARPRALIIVPNRELAVQILAVAKSLSGATAGRFRSLASTGFIPLRKLTRAFESPVDLLVVTPGRLEFLLSASRVHLTDVKYVVFDETDTLLAPDQGFSEGLEQTVLGMVKHKDKEWEKQWKAEQKEQRKTKEAQQVQEHVNGEETSTTSAVASSSTTSVVPILPSRPPIQLIFCSASISPEIERYLHRSFPSLHRVHTPSLHHLPENLLMKNILTGNDDKRQVLLDVLKKESQSYIKRLMHGRTREQNKKDLEAHGGNQQKWIESILQSELDKRFGGVIGGGGQTPLTDASEIHRKNQLRYNEEAQDDMTVVKDLATSPAVQAQDDQQTVYDDEDRSDPDHPSNRQVDRADEPIHPPLDAGSKPKLFLPLPPTMIFCNTVSCCRAVAWFLTEQGLDVGHYHGLMPSHYRTHHFRNFLTGTTSILVSTDLGSRGLDTTFVQHVIHFDFPTQVVDFMHRVGRTARNGRKGKSTALVQGRDRTLAEGIERLTSRGLSIEQLTRDRSRYGPDGLPLSGPAPTPAAADATGTPIVPIKTKLPPARVASTRTVLQPGTQPRRRWMRYMTPTQRNEHKLLYSHDPSLATRKDPHKLTVGEMRREQSLGVQSKAQARRLLRQDGGDHRPGTSARHRKDHAPSSSTSSPTKERTDPFAFSAPPQFRPAKHELYAQARERAAAKHRAPTKFPSASTTRRPHVSRPLGPLAHKQKVGALFSAGKPAVAKGKGGTGKDKASAAKQKQRASNRANSDIRERTGKAAQR